MGRMENHYPRPPFWRRYRWLWIPLLLLAFLFTVGQASLFARQQALAELQQRSLTDLNRYVLSLQQKLDRYKDLPSLLATHSALVTALKVPESREARRQANVYLASVSTTIEASDVYIMSAEGVTIAASNWLGKSSFVDKNFAFRPYFQEAIAGRPGRYFALGTTSRKRGYYFSYPVYSNEQVIGVVVVKIDLHEIEADWSDALRDILVTDEDGVIFISTRWDWKFRTLNPLSAATLKRIIESSRYQHHELDALEVIERRQLGEDSQLITLMEGERISNAALDGVRPAEYLLQSRKLPEAGLDVSILASLKPVQRQMYNAAMLAAVICLALTLLVAFLITRERIKRERARFKQQRTAALEESEARVRAVIDNTWAGLITLDPQGRIESCNSTAQKLFGYSETQLRGQYFSLLLCQADRALCWQHITAPDERRPDEFYLEAQARHAAGEQFPVELVIGQIRVHDGQHFIITIHDITQRKQYEAQLQRARELLEQRVAERTADLTRANSQLMEEMAQHKNTQNELIQTAKLAVLGQMSAGINHELNQPLTAIRAYADNARAFLGLGKLDRVQGNLEEIGGLTERMAKIIHPLKEFSRKSSGQPEPVCLKTVRDGAMSILYGRLNQQGAQISWPGGLERRFVMGDVVRLEQVLVNLISNALQAMDSMAQKQIEISVEQEEQWLTLKVRDHGPGVAEGEQSRVFEPFYTTKASGQGLGLGLSISHRIIASLNGALSVSNHPGGGAVFSIRLPRAEAPQPEQMQPPR